MHTDQDLYETVRAEMWTLLDDRYRTQRRGSHGLADEYLTDRTFWPAFRFLGVTLNESEEGVDQLQVTFSVIEEPVMTFGFKIDVARALVEWTKRVGGRDPREYPGMFAAELIWFMVCFIGVADFTTADVDDDVRWINQGPEIFGKLPNNPNMEAFESHS